VLAALLATFPEHLVEPENRNAFSG
jgi:hypothetical protein